MGLQTKREDRPMGKVPRPRVVAKQRLANLDLPAQVTLSLAELADAAKEHLLSLSVALGLATLQELFASELTRLVGPKGKHRADRSAYRHGTERRWVTLGGRLVEIERPRARGRDGTELPLATYAAVADRDLLTEAALARMLAGLSGRHYEQGLEPVGDDVRSRGTSRSAVSRRFVQGTAAKLAQVRSRDISGLGILAVFIDGIEIADHTVVVALGVDERAGKHVLGLAEGTTENAATCRSLVSDLIERGLPTERAVLFVDVRCSDPSGYESFNVVVNSILDEVRRGVVPREAVATVLARWRRFWGSVPEVGLSPDQVRGLFGELWFLLVWLLPHEADNVNHWVGSTGARHDFQWPALAVEAKATLSIRGHVHRINGLDQLDSPDEGELYFFSLRVREEPSAANSVVSLVERVSAALTGRADLLDTFEARLAQAGYSPAHAERYRSMLFRVVDERLYRVTAGFPRLSGESFQGGLPAGIERIEYEVNLDACHDLIVSRDPARPGLNIPSAIVALPTAPTRSTKNVSRSSELR